MKRVTAVCAAALLFGACNRAPDEGGLDYTQEPVQERDQLEPLDQIQLEGQAQAPTPAQTRPSEPDQPAIEPGQIHRASDLLATNVKNHQDENLGEVQDLVLDFQTGKISYAVISMGGFLGIGQKDVAIPLRALNRDPESNLLYLGADREQLEAAPEFDPENLQASLVWGEAAAQREQQLSLIKASDLMGKAVENPKGQDLGKIDDLAVDLEDEQVPYAVLSIGGLLGIGEKLLAIPLGAFSRGAEAEDTLILAVEKSRIENAEGFHRDDWPRMADTAWGAQRQPEVGQPPAAPRPPSGFRLEGGEDQILAQRVRREIMLDEALTFPVQQIQIDVENGRIILRGSVRSEQEKEQIARRAENVEGVQEVDNQLEIREQQP